MVQENKKKIVLYNSNTRIVITEKFVVPEWFKRMLESKQTSLLHNKSLLETYRIFLRIIYGDELTITEAAKAEINKYRKSPEIINMEFALFLIKADLIGLDSGNWETKEEHWNIYQSPNYSSK